ncbi:MAG: hypothetical protein AB1633_11460 [Elusimicrobiota bacterium]
MNPNSTNTDKIIPVLLEQYRCAIDLYKHEDLVNWNKISNLLYVNTGLCAAFGWLMSIKNNAFRYVAPLLALSGVIVCFVFFISLLNGKTYIDLRKRNVSTIESHIGKIVELELLFSDETSIRKRVKMRTMNVIIWLSLFLMICWLLYFCYTLGLFQNHR